MTDDRSMEERIRSNAELVVSVACNQLGKDIGYDEAGVQWLDGYIQRQHEQGDPADRPGLVGTLGSFLGECIIRSLGGAWAQNLGVWCVQFDENNAAFPFAKVANQLDNGEEDSVASFFSAVPLVLKKAR
jgi:hypothetical protein